MPKPLKNETRQAYVARAIPMLMSEGLTRKQAVGKAEGMADGFFPHSKKTREWKKGK